MATIGQTNTPQGSVSRHFTANITRSTTSNAALFTLPAGVTILAARILGSVDSDAGTDARISIGCNTSERVFVSEYNVKTNGNLMAYPSSFLLLGTLTDPNPVNVIGRYDETGDASTTGGPWTVDIECL